jgi:type I restriction-modification system DNA methylase subunit
MCGFCYYSPACFLRYKENVFGGVFIFVFFKAVAFFYKLIVFDLDASEYKSVVLGLIFLKYISDRFEAKYNELVEEGDGFEEDKKDNNKEEEWLKDLKDDYLSVGKALLNEGKSAYEIISILERLDFLGSNIFKNINNSVASVYRSES